MRPFEPLRLAAPLAAGLKRPALRLAGRAPLVFGVDVRRSRERGVAPQMPLTVEANSPRERSLGSGAAPLRQDAAPTPVAVVRVYLSESSRAADAHAPSGSVFSEQGWRARVGTLCRRLRTRATPSRTLDGARKGSNRSSGLSVGVRDLPLPKLRPAPTGRGLL
jgi:hypothetical protein